MIATLAAKTLSECDWTLSRRILIIITLVELERLDSTLNYTTDFSDNTLNVCCCHRTTQPQSLILPLPGLVPLTYFRADSPLLRFNKYWMRKAILQIHIEENVKRVIKYPVNQEHEFLVWQKSKLYLELGKGKSKPIPSAGRSPKNSFMLIPTFRVASYTEEVQRCWLGWTRHKWRGKTELKL